MADVAPSVRASMGEALSGVLANPGIRRIELAWTAGIAADWAYLVAMLVVAYGVAGPVGVGVLGAVRMVPPTLLGPFAASPLQSLFGSRALVAVHATRAGAAFGTAILLAVGGPLLGAFILAGIVAGVGSLVRPIQSAVLPALARSPGELVAANVASSTGEGIGTFGGPLIGAFVVGLGGPAWTCAVVAILGSVATAGVAGIRWAATEAFLRHGTETQTDGLTPDSGVRALQSRPGAALVVVGFFAQTFVRGLLITLIVVASIELLGLGEAGIGLLSASIGAGGFAGAGVALSLARRPRLAPAFALALALWGLPIAVIGAWPVAILAAGALFVTGVSNAVLDVAGFTLLQRSVPHQSRLAVFGLFEGVVGLGVAAGGLTAPLLLGVFGPRGALVVAGAILPIVAVVTWPGITRTDGEVVIPERQLALLRGIPLFAPFPLVALEGLAGATVPVEFAPGEVLMEQGEPGDRYIVIETGDVAVTDAGRYLRTIGPGEGIGEIALLRQVPRTATVTAIGRVTGYALDAAAFLDAVAAPASSTAAAVVIGERLAHSTKARSIE